MESTVYPPRGNGLAERAVQTVKRAVQARSPNLNESFGAFLQRALMTHRNISKTRGKVQVEILLGRRVRLPAIADFDLCEPNLFKANEKTKPVPASFIIRKGLNTSFIQAENSARTILVSGNQIARRDEDNVKTEPAVEETISQSEQQLQNTDVRPSLQDEASAATSSAEHQQPETSEPSRTLTRNRKQSDRLGESIPTNLLEKGGRMRWFQRNIKKLRSFLYLSFKERKKNLPDNLVNSSTNRNLILTSADLQLMNSIVPKPYMILMKCWWK